jgi:hypothetical protein
MKAVIEAGVTNLEELVKINRVRFHQQVLFVSDILDAGGKRLNKKYPKQRQDNELCSTLIFPSRSLHASTANYGSSCCTPWLCETRQIKVWDNS